MLRRFALSTATAGSMALAVGSPAMAIGNFLPISTSVTAWTATGAGPVTASSANLTIQDVTNGLTINCSSTHAGGTLHTSGSGADPVVDGLAVTPSGCTGTMPPTFTLTPNTFLGAWEVYVISPFPPVRAVAVTGVSFKTSSLGGLCVTQIDGSGGASSQTGQVNGTYNNSTGILTLTGSPNLTVAAVSLGCLGAIKKNDVITVTGSFPVTSSPAPIIS
ncbi:hypothetical protein EDD29_4898 [Actinocorallia herbida]|uniref:Neocarzinostatin family protein n=1 Tax=Actinocorallia herbida TaxID=58109 RepID=A0A3N1D1B1_9ACTN|nr:hypothetical protein [Actinocorallia herbida]ROO87301.1 hypothetical protein EDD29_4898 [Actinocorallia herbida]